MQCGQKTAIFNPNGVILMTMQNRKANHRKNIMHWGRKTFKIWMTSKIQSLRISIRLSID